MRHSIGCDQAFEQGMVPTDLCGLRHPDFRGVVDRIPFRWFVSGLGILTRVACTHSRVCFIEHESRDGAILEHGLDGCRGNVTESDVDFFHREWIGDLYLAVFHQASSSRR